MELKHYKVGQRFAKTTKPRSNFTNLEKKDYDMHVYVPIGSAAGGIIPEQS